MLVLNDTKVIPARLIGKKVGTGGKIELFLLREREADGQRRSAGLVPFRAVWEVLAKPYRRLKVGTRVSFGDGELIAEVLEIPGDRHCQVGFCYEGTFADVLARVGQVPLPPYIKRAPTAEDATRYQCVYAETEGAVAAPTAGLHFTQELLERLRGDGIETAALTLHVGIGTFQPVTVEDISLHNMPAEYIQLSAAVAARIRSARAASRKIVAVGTTVVRALETAGSTGSLKPYRGDSELFIYPGYQFNVVDALITNFHLPNSTLLMLVSAFADAALIREAYQEALRHHYRFYSYGDAMLIL